MKYQWFFLVICFTVATLFTMPAHANKKKGSTHLHTHKQAEVVKTPPKKVATYTYTDRHFSFSLPVEWTQKNNDINSGNAVFVAQPETKTCSFEVNLALMQPNFNAEETVTEALKEATQAIKKGLNLAAKRRDELGMEKGKSVKYARGWEVLKKAQDGYQGIVYQAYDKENYSLYFSGTAEAAHFEECRPELEKIMKSIKFGD